MVHIFGSLERNDLYCVGFQNSALRGEKDVVLMGGQHCTALANPFCSQCCVLKLCFNLFQILYFQTNLLSMTWKIKSLGGLTTTVSASTLKSADT